MTDTERCCGTCSRWKPLDAFRGLCTWADAAAPQWCQQQPGVSRAYGRQCGAYTEQAPDKNVGLPVDKRGKGV